MLDLKVQQANATISAAHRIEAAASNSNEKVQKQVKHCRIESGVRNDEVQKMAASGIKTSITAKDSTDEGFSNEITTP